VCWVHCSFPTPFLLRGSNNLQSPKLSSFFCQSAPYLCSILLPVQPAKYPVPSAAACLHIALSPPTASLTPPPPPFPLPDYAPSTRARLTYRPNTSTVMGRPGTAAALSTDQLRQEWLTLRGELGVARSQLASTRQDKV